MKKSKLVTLVLITAALASCHKKKVEDDWSSGNQQVYLRTDTTANYSRAHCHGNGWLWYYAFRPYGTYFGNGYHHAGYYSNAISEHSNIGTSSAKSSVVRGGFGHGTFSVSS